MTETLKPCPWCGPIKEKPFQNLRDGDFEDDTPIKCWTIFHECENLRTTIIADEADEQSCINAWNTHHGEDLNGR